MKFLNLYTKNPYLNLAIEEYMFDKFEDSVFILWQNEPTVVIGKNQNAYTEVDVSAANERGVHIARRITGGGAVYHDLGNLNYTFIADGEDKTLNFEYFTAPIIKALSSLGITATLSGRNDIEINGKKISGNAQCNRGGRVLHHGTLLFDSDLDILSGILRVDKEKIESKAVKSVRVRVGNIKEFLPSDYTLTDFVNLIKSYVLTELGAEEISAPLNSEILAFAERNASCEWLFPNRAMISDYRIKRKKRFPFGTVEISLLVANDLIKDAIITGDFFECADILELQDKLRGIKLAELGEKIPTLSVREYVYGMSDDDFSSLLRNI